MRICDIKGYEDIKEFYEVTREGQVINVKSGKILKQRIKKNGYKEVGLLRNDKRVAWIRVNRLIALAFIPNPMNKPYVNHIDENRANNSIDNLEWVTPKENNLHSLAKEVYMYDLEGNNLKKYKYTGLVVEDGFNRGHVCAVARGEEKSHKGYIFSYKKLTKSEIAQRLSKTYFRK